MDYYQKYLKYKSKYTKLKNQIEIKKIKIHTDNNLIKYPIQYPIQTILKNQFINNQKQNKKNKQITEFIENQAFIDPSIQIKSIKPIKKYVNYEIITNVKDHFKGNFQKYIISSHGEPSANEFIVLENIELYFFNPHECSFVNVLKIHTHICDKTISDKDFAIQRQYSNYLFHVYKAGALINDYMLSKDKSINKSFRSGITECNKQNNKLIYNIDILHTADNIDILHTADTKVNDTLYFSDMINFIIKYHFIKYIQNKINFTFNDIIALNIDECKTLLPTLKEPIRIYSAFCR